MATKITVTLEDDLDGGPAGETVRFGLAGAAYEIDLSAKNARAFRTRLAPYLDHTRMAGPAQRRRPARTAARRQGSSGIRAWAKDPGQPGQRPRAHPRQRCPAVPGRHLTILTSQPVHRRCEPVPARLPPALTASQQRAARPFPAARTGR